MSDDFEAPGLTFGEGSYPRCTALHKDYYTNSNKHFYYHDNTYTNNYGKLVILTESAYTETIRFEEVTKKLFLIQITSASP